MIDGFFVFAAIIFLFFIILAVKSFLKKEFCVICAAVSLTWISLLVLYKMNLFNNPLLIAVLMGQSVLGIFYLVEKNAGNAFKLFRLPFLLSLTFVAYSFVSASLDLPVLKLLAVLWFVFAVIFLYRNNSRMKSFVDKIVACCKWG